MTAAMETGFGLGVGTRVGIALVLDVQAGRDAALPVFCSEGTIVGRFPYSELVHVLELVFHSRVGVFRVLTFEGLLVGDGECTHITMSKVAVSFDGIEPRFGLRDVETESTDSLFGLLIIRLVGIGHDGGELVCW